MTPLAHRPDRRHRQRQEHGRARCCVGLGAALVDTDAIARALDRCPAAPRSTPIARRVRRRLHRRRRRPRPRRACASSRSPTPTRKARLEAILHPLIGAEVERQARSPRAAPVARLRHAAAGRVGPLARPRRPRLVVDCGEATQVERVVRAPGLDRRRGARGDRPAGAARRAPRRRRRRDLQRRHRARRARRRSRARCGSAAVARRA